MTDARPTRAADVSDERGWFDGFADRASNTAAKPGFFLGLVGLVLAWLALGPWADFSHVWIDALQIIGTIVTVLLVVLLENEQWRNSKATQRKLNALAGALAHLLEADPTASTETEQLRAAVGLEKRESISR